MENQASHELARRMREQGRMVRAVVLRVGGPAAAGLVDDVAQQVFLELWKQLERGRRIEHPASYLYRAAVRETVRALRRERHHCARGDEGETIESTPDPRGGPIDRVREKEVQATLEAAAAGLAPSRRTAVRAHLYGHSVQEIMRREGWGYHRARNLIARGMADLRRGLRTRGCCSWSS